MTQIRTVDKILRGMPASDGAGVRLTRYIGTPEVDSFDPFLLLDAFGSDNADDYIAGFPSHPHRGFETVTYMFAGRMRHADSTGYSGVIETGGVQWMTAAGGIIHSEMPEQTEGLLEGIQLWINLPAAHKMRAPGYQEFTVAQLPVEQRPGCSVTVVTGRTSQGTEGPIRDIATAPLYLDVRMAAGAHFSEPVPASHAAFVYCVDGNIRIGSGGAAVIVPAHTLTLLSAGDQVECHTDAGTARLLLVAAMRLNEPVARAGPFVMNTRAEIMQAFDDYRSGRFAG